MNDSELPPPPNRIDRCFGNGEAAGSSRVRRHWEKLSAAWPDLTRHERRMAVVQYNIHHTLVHGG